MVGVIESQLEFGISCLNCIFMWIIQSKAAPFRFALQFLFMEVITKWSTEVDFWLKKIGRSLQPRFYDTFNKTQCDELASIYECL